MKLLFTVVVFLLSHTWAHPESGEILYMRLFSYRCGVKLILLLVWGCKVSEDEAVVLLLFQKISIYYFCFLPSTWTWVHPAPGEILCEQFFSCMYMSKCLNSCSGGTVRPVRMKLLWLLFLITFTWTAVEHRFTQSQMRFCAAALCNPSSVCDVRVLKLWPEWDCQTSEDEAE